MRRVMRHVFEETPETLGAWCEGHGMRGFRARQVLEWVYRRSTCDAGAMTNISARDREIIARELSFRTCGVLMDRTASDGTRKLLVQWKGQEEGALRDLPMFQPDPARQTECVMIPSLPRAGARARRTACISSQIGCPVGCRFCASGIGGLDGNLTAGRIVEQVWLLDHLTRADEPGLERGITHVVFMGMGEPLANFSNVVRAVRTLASPWGMNISARRITISTVGLPRAIERLAEELELPVTLALSLHAPNDELRRSLIPWAEHATISEILSACRKWFEKTGREITLEYILLRGVNDGEAHARELAAVARTLRANVNLIRYNEVASLPFERPTDEAVRWFQAILRERNVNTHIRASRGRDIEAACGQLRHEKTEAAR